MFSNVFLYNQSTKWSPDFRFTAGKQTELNDRGLTGNFSSSDFWQHWRHTDGQGRKLNFKIKHIPETDRQVTLHFRTPEAKFISSRGHKELTNSLLIDFFSWDSAGPSTIHQNKDKQKEMLTRSVQKPDAHQAGNLSFSNGIHIKTKKDITVKDSVFKRIISGIKREFFRAREEKCQSAGRAFSSVMNTMKLWSDLRLSTFSELNDSSVFSFSFHAAGCEVWRMHLNK